MSAVFVHESLYGCGIAYTITAASSVKYELHTNPLSAFDINDCVYWSALALLY